MKTTNQIDREANERKAREIAQSVSFFWTNEDDCEKSIIDTAALRKAIFNAALQAMSWKDKERKELWRITRNHYQEWAEEQIAQEKQQLIDKAWDWLTNQKGEHTKEDFIKSMKGE